MRKPWAILFLAISFSAACACAETSKYDAGGKRDPFVPLIGQDRSAVLSLADITSVDDIKLEGIALGADGRSTAILNGEMLKEGDRAGDIEIQKITNTSVIILMAGKIFEIRLPEEGGSKGE